MTAKRSFRPAQSSVISTRRRTAVNLFTAGLLDHDLDALELLELGVAGGGQRALQGADEVHGAVGHPGGTEEDLLERADGRELHPLAARQVGVVRLPAPVEAPPGRV